MLKILKILRKASQNNCVYDYAYPNYSADTGQYENVPWRSPKSPNVRDLQVTSEGLSGDQY